MRRPVTSLPALLASVALAIPPFALPLRAQQAEGEADFLMECTSAFGAANSALVAECLVPELMQAGLSPEDAAARAQELAQIGAETPVAEEPPAEQPVETPA
ncbi:MAG: hypothetical protein WBA67_03395, partial [Jannaschia sp.]